jgi:hypothetical protein
MTDFSNVCNILAKIYSDFRDDEAFEQFVEINDIGLPLAYFTADGLCEVSPDGAKYISATWDSLLENFAIEDTGFQSLEDLIKATEL